MDLQPTSRRPLAWGFLLVLSVTCVRALPFAREGNRDLWPFLSRPSLRPSPLSNWGRLQRCRGGGGGGGGGRWGAPQPTENSGRHPAWGSSAPLNEDSSAGKWGSFLDSREEVLTPRVVSDIKQRDSRMGLIRKVYGILGMQLLATAAVCFYFNQNRSIVRWLMSDSGSWALLLAFGTALGSAIALGFDGLCRRSPWNLLLLALFTGGESVFIGAISAMYRSSSVLLAAFQAGVATIGLTAYAFQKNPKYDLTAFGGSLASALLIFSSSVILSMFLKVSLPDAAVGGMGALLFSVFLVYDTQRIVGGPDKAQQLDDRDYVRGALELYLDITRIFLYLLQTFGKVQQQNSD